MNNKALVVIDIQNDITKHYRDIIDNINAAIEWAMAEGMHIVYIKHNNITAATRTFKPGSKGEGRVRQYLREDEKQCSYKRGVCCIYHGKRHQ